MNGEAGPGPKVLVLATSSLLLIIGAYAVLGTGSDDEWHSTPLPFDPLSSEEQTEALTTLLNDPAVVETLSDRHITIGAALHTDKAHRDLEVWPRMAEAWLYDYGHNQAIRGIVDLGEQAVVQVDMPQVQPPIASSEVHAAGQLAFENDQVKARIQETGYSPDMLEATARLWTGPGPTACPDHRCLLVKFQAPERFIDDFTVRVDLTKGEITGILGPHGSPVEENIGGII